MYTTAGRICAYILVPVVLAGCTRTASDESHSPWRSPWALTTTATVRGVYRTNAEEVDDFNRIKPEHVTCAEPSPDVASAVSESFGLALTAAGQEPKTSIEAELAASVASSSAQAIAQLGERLATIQLLRDGLYRACEAYANGAITPTTYTLIVSRIDDLMVTLLSTEIAGGAFGRELAALGGETMGSAAAIQGAVGSAAEAAKLEREVEAAKATLSEKQANLDEVEKQQADDPSTDRTTEITTKKSERDQAAADLATKEGELREAQAVAQFTRARSEAIATFQAGGGLDRAPNVEIAEQIAGIQESYLADFNLDAIMAACVTELSQASSRKQNGESMLAKHCERLIPGVQDVLEGSVKLRKKELETGVIKAQAEADATRTEARAASARFELGRAIFEFCEKKADQPARDACVDTQAKVFGLSTDEQPVP